MGEFSPQFSMALAGIALLPVIVWFLLRRKSIKFLLFGAVSILLFSSGTLEILGVSTSITRIAAEMLVVACFMLTVLRPNSGGKRLPGLFALVAFIATALVSLLFSDENPVMVLFFYRDYLIAPLFFYSTINSRFNDQEVRAITKLLQYLFLSQIAANFIKLMVIGHIEEPYIGTMANLGGSLTIIFALVGSVVCISLYLSTKNVRYFIGLLGFVAFSLIGEKRATIVYVPFVYWALLMARQAYTGMKLKPAIKQGSLLLAASVLLIYFAVRLIPSLNEEHQVWGSFDIAYAMDYSTDYLTTGAGAIEEVGRLNAPGYLLGSVASESKPSFFFGHGAGHLVKSSFNDLAVRLGNQSDISMYLYGVGYAARTAFLQLFLQVGVIGVVLYLLVWIRIFISERKLQKASESSLLVQKSAVAVMMVGIALVFLLDFFTYSVVSVQLGAVSVSIALLLAVLRGRKPISV
jgi:hypothetical protein